MNRFTIIPKRHEGQSDIGYVLSILNRHGIQSTEHLIDTAEVRRLIKSLPVKSDLLKSIQVRTEKNGYSQNPLFQFNRFTEPKVCPECLLEDGVHRQSWLNVFYVHCEKHHCELVTHCDECQSALEWEPVLLKGVCTNDYCNHVLRKIPAEVSLSQEQASDCILAHYLASNTATFINRTKHPVLPELQSTINTGYRLLTDPKVQISWVESLIKANPMLPIEWRLLSLSLLLKNLRSHWPSLHQLSCFQDTKACLQLENSQLKPSEFIVTTSHACELIGITLLGLQSLYNAGLVKTRTGNSLSSKSIINIAPIFSVIDFQSDIKEKVNISDTNAILAYHSVSISDVIIAASNKKLNLVYRPSSSLSQSIYCRESELSELCQSLFAGIQDEYIEISQALKLVKATKPKLMQLRRAGKFRPPRWSRTGNDQLVLFEDVLRARKQFHVQGEFDFSNSKECDVLRSCD